MQQEDDGVKYEGDPGDERLFGRAVDDPDWSEVDPFAEMDAETARNEKARKLCFVVSIASLAAAVACMFGAHKGAYWLATEHFLVLLAVAALVGLVAACFKWAWIARMVTRIVGLAGTAGIFYVTVGGWCSILVKGKIGEGEILIEAWAGLGLCVAVGMLAFCQVYHGSGRAAKGYDRVFPLVAVPIWFSGLAFLVVVMLNGMLLIEARMQAGTDPRSLTLTDKQLSEIGSGLWKCRYDGTRRMATCGAPF